jgi:hypothetical protein
MRGQYFVNGLHEALVNIGFSKDGAKRFSQHGENEEIWLKMTVLADLSFFRGLKTLDNSKV